MKWTPVVINVPAGGGSVVETNLPTPDAMMFFGTNFTTEDAVVTTTGTGLFRGMAVPKWDAPGTLLQNAVTAVPAGDAHKEDDYGILMIDTGGLSTPLYRATVSFQDGGFTANFDIGAAGYKVLCLILSGVDNMAGIETGFGTFDLGFRAKSGLVHGSWAGPVISGTDRTQAFYGGAAYPPSSLDWRGAWLTAFCFPTSFSQQYFNSLQAFSGATGFIAQGGHFLGPFLNTANLTARLQGVGQETVAIDLDSANDGGLLAFFDQESWTDINSPAQAVAGEYVRTGLDFAPHCLIGYTISDEPNSQATGGRGALGLTVVTKDFQWCATIDGVGRGAYQSFQKGFCDTVTASDYHGGECELTNDGFIWTTDHNGTTAHEMAWHAFEGRRFLPQIWRPRAR